MLAIKNEPFHIAKRAKMLFDQYISENHDPMLDVTICIIALGSVLSYLKKKNSFPQQLQSDPKQISLLYQEAKNDDSLNTTCRHMRNSIAHSYIKVKGSGESIESICFEDFKDHNEYLKKTPNFSLEISVANLNKFFIELLNYTMDNNL